MTLLPILTLAALSQAPARAQTLGFETQIQPVRASFENEEDQLVASTRDPDSAIRQAAVHGLRQYLQDPAVRARLAQMVDESWEVLSVRKEAMKSLSMDWSDDPTTRFLLGEAASNPDRALRVLALKALYASAPWNEDARDYLLDVAKTGETDLRLGAIWGLFEASSSGGEVKDALLSLAGPGQPAAARIEAVKSLFSAMSYPDVRAAVFQLAQDKGGEEGLREAAVLALSADTGDSDLRQALRDLSGSDESAGVRRAAILALNDAGGEWAYVFFHLGYRRQLGGAYVDPIDRE